MDHKNYLKAKLYSCLLKCEFDDLTDSDANIMFELAKDVDIQDILASKGTDLENRMNSAKSINESLNDSPWKPEY